MATDYDAPRRSEADAADQDSVEALKAERTGSQSASTDVDDGDTVESYELPGADLSNEELSIKVVPRQQDEFTCMGCFLVHHRSRLAEVTEDGELLCVDCAG